MSPPIANRKYPHLIHDSTSSTSKVAAYLYDQWGANKTPVVKLPCFISVSKRLTKKGIPKITNCVAIISGEIFNISPPVFEDLEKSCNLLNIQNYTFTSVWTITKSISQHKLTKIEVNPK